MLITAVDAALERLVREQLPLPEDVGDVAFDVPDRAWGARQSRVAVNLFLFDVGRSDRPMLAPALREGADGRLERRPPLPIVRLSYLVTAWASSLRDEHQLLGDVLACLLTHSALDASYFAADLPATAMLNLAQREGRKPGDIQSGLDGQLKPGIEIEVTLALDQAWVPAATEVSSVEATVPFKTEPAPEPQPERLTRRRRIPGGAVVSERVER